MRLAITISSNKIEGALQKSYCNVLQIMVQIHRHI